MTHKSIDLYLDFSSPYSAIAILRIRKEFPELLNRISPKIILLAAIYDKFGSAPIAQPLKFDYELMDIPRTANFYSIDGFQIPQNFPDSPVFPSRIFLHLARNKDDRALKYLLGVYEGYFCTHGELMLKEIGANVALELGISLDEQKEINSAPINKQALFQSSAQAIETGVFGCPFFIMGGETYWGSDRIDQLVHSMGMIYSKV